MRFHFLCVLWLVPLASASGRPLDACGTLDRPGATYVLQKDVSSPGTCFLIAADGITLDLNQHTITYGTVPPGAGEATPRHVHGVLAQACWDTAGHADPALCADRFSELTVKNGAIVQAEGAPPFSHGIRVGQGNMRNLTVDGVSLRISSASTVGILVEGGRGGHRFRNVTVENHSVHVFNRHQLEGAAIKVSDMGQGSAPDHIEGLKVVGGPQTGVIETVAGSRILGSHIALRGAFTNDFGIMLLGEAMEARDNAITGRGRGLQVDSRGAVVSDNTIETYEEAVNQEYAGCQPQGTFGIQVEARAAKSIIRQNTVTARATACDARALRVTGTGAGNGNRFTRNMYRAVRDVASTGKAVAASFADAKDVLLEGDTLYADTWNTEVGWDGGQDIVLRNVTFIKGANARADYATFVLLPGSNDPVKEPNSARLRVIDPVFRDGASADSFFMRPIGFGGWAAPAEYTVEWGYALQVTVPDGKPLAGVQVSIMERQGTLAFRGVTDADGRIPPVPLKEFRRFNHPHGVKKEEFSYEVTLALGARQRRFSLRAGSSLAPEEVLP